MSEMRRYLQRTAVTVEELEGNGIIESWVDVNLIKIDGGKTLSTFLKIDFDAYSEVDQDRYNYRVHAKTFYNYLERKLGWIRTTSSGRLAYKGFVIKESPEHHRVAREYAERKAQADEWKAGEEAIDYWYATYVEADGFSLVTAKEAYNSYKASLLDGVKPVAATSFGRYLGANYAPERKYVRGQTLYIGWRLRSEP